MKLIQNTDKYQALVEQCQAIMTEGVFNSRYALISAYFALGETIRGGDDLCPISELVGLVARDIGLTERTVWYAVAAYDKFKSPDNLPSGKAISWAKVKRLVSGKPEEATCDHRNTITICVCDDCGKKMS